MFTLIILLLREEIIKTDLFWFPISQWHNREEKSLRHITMVAKFLDLSKPWSCKYGKRNPSRVGHQGDRGGQQSTVEMLIWSDIPLRGMSAPWLTKVLKAVWSLYIILFLIFLGNWYGISANLWRSLSFFNVWCVAVKF